MNEDINKRIHQAAMNYIHPVFNGPVMRDAYITGTEFMLSLVLEVLESHESRQEFFNRDKQGSPLFWASYLRDRFGVK